MRYARIGCATLWLRSHSLLGSYVGRGAPSRPGPSIRISPTSQVSVVESAVYNSSTALVFRSRCQVLASGTDHRRTSRVGS